MHGRADVPGPSLNYFAMLFCCSEPVPFDTIDCPGSAGAWGPAGIIYHSLAGIEACTSVEPSHHLDKVENGAMCVRFRSFGDLVDI